MCLQLGSPGGHCRKSPQREAKVIVLIVHGQLPAQARLVFAERADAPPDRGDMLTDRWLTAQ